MTLPRHILARVVAGALSVALAACGSSSGTVETDPDTVTPPNNVVVAGAETIISVDSASPIAGASVSVPADAVAGGQVEVVIGFEDQPPGPLRPEAVAEGATMASKTYVLTKSRPGSFDNAVSVTVPYDSRSLAPGDVPSVLYWDEASSSYRAMAVTAYDEGTGRVTFRTVHFSKFVVAAVKGLGAQFKGAAPAGSALDADSGYRPSTDGFFRANISSYSSPGGNCLGMAAFADWFYERAKSPLNGGQGLFSTYLEGNLASQQDDVIAEELIVRAHAAASQDWARRLLVRYATLSSDDVAASLVQAIKLTGLPQLFVMHGNPSWWEQYIQGKASWGHALVAYRYSHQDGVIYLYDPNLRGDDTAGIKYVPGQGFQGLTKTGLYPTEPDQFAFDSVSAIYGPADMRALFDGAASGWDEGRYGKVAFELPVVDPNTRTAVVTDRTGVRMVGTVTSVGGDAANAPNTVDVYIAGAFDKTYPVTAGRFDFTLPVLPEAPSTEVLMVARCNACAPTIDGDVGSRKTSIYGTFTRIRIRTGSILDNWGFERGNFDRWDSLRYLLTGGGEVRPSDKSEVVQPGFDPIATSISTVLHGSFAARINNFDRSYHVSRVTRDVTVPADGAPFALAFNWAAVLEDPEHDPVDQPFVNIEVINIDTGEALYKRRYYSNDPSFPGWKSFRGGDWKAIDWQSVRLDSLERFAGNTLRVIVEAADCGRGAHGGYAYFDAEE